MSDLLRSNAARRPDAMAMGDDRNPDLTWAELDAAVTRTANALLAAGPRPGDRVTLQLATGLEFVLVYLGALRAGLVAVPINPAYTATETDQIRADCGAALHVGPAEVMAILEAARAEHAHDADPRADRSGEDIAVLLYTSGTGGRPKGAMLSVRALLANLDQLASIDPPLLTEDDVLYLPLPLAHVFGLNAGLGMALRTGAAVVLADRFDPRESLAVMARRRVTAVVGVPGQFAEWLRSPDFDSAFGSVRFAMSGSATLAGALVQSYAEHGVALHDGYGLTEAAPVVTVNATAEQHRPGSIGRPLPGIEVQLRDGDGDEVDLGDPGRITIRGANLFSGYWPDGRDGPDADGWFGTGDVAVADTDGELHLVGRSTELVIVNGFNVYPAEVEAVFARLPGVAEVAVTGEPDERTGEAVVAYVVPVPGTRLDGEQLRGAVADRLARFKVPSRVDVVDALPHTVTGKIMRWQLGHTGAAR